MNARRGCSIIAGQDRADSRSTGSREMDTAFIPTVFPFVVTRMPGAHFLLPIQAPAALAAATALENQFPNCLSDHRQGAGAHRAQNQ